ncbi:MAG: NDP-sugar synthase, partial [Thermofilaceae archaeon]
IEVTPLTYRSLDTADAVRRASNVIDEDFLVIMGDIVTNCDIGSMWKMFERKKSIAMIVLKDVDTPNHYGLAVTASDDRIIGFLEKPTSFELYLASIAMKSMKSKYCHANLANTGIYALSYSVLDVLEDNPHLLDFGRHVFPYLLEEGYPIYSWYMGPYYWIDAGLPSTYLRANIDLLNHQATPLKPRGLCSGGIWFNSYRMIHGSVLPPAAIGEVEIIEEEVVVGPYVVLGDGVHICDKAIVAESVLMDNVKVRKGASIENSIIGANVEIGERAEVKYSIVEDGAVIPDKAKVFGEVVSVEPRKERPVTMIELGARI